VSDQDSTFMANFMGVLGILVVIAIVFYFIAQLVVEDDTEMLAENPMMAELIEKNIKPVGQVRTTDDAPVTETVIATAGQARSGKTVYDSSCLACHGAGVAGAPKTGDQGAWKTRAAQGMAVLVEHAINGFNAMPAKGTCADCSDSELAAAVTYMLTESGVEGAGAAPEESSAPPASGAGTDTGAVNGEQVVQGACLSCHGTGVAGAPKIGDKAAWAPRIAQGDEALLTNAIQGLRAMPPRGACMNCTDADLKAAVDYMVSQSE